MSIGFVDFIFSALVALLGVLTGWACHKATRRGTGRREASTAPLEQAEGILAKLHDLAAGVAADVGEHNSQVEAINCRLNSEGGDDAEVVVDAVGKLLAANSQMQQQLDSAEEQLRRQAREIESQTAAARTDALTGLANRRVFDDEIATLTRKFEEDATPFAVTILDIDHFKKFNDTHGHKVGDLVLQHAARVYRDSVPGTDIVTRFGGEEFALIHPGTTVEAATRRADFVRRALDASPVHSEGKKLHVTASLGVAQARSDEEPAALLERADEALYAAKEAGRNRTYWHCGSESHPFSEEASQTQNSQPRPSSDSEPIVRPQPARRTTDLQKSLLDRPRFLAHLGKSTAATAEGESPPVAFLVRADRFDDHVDRYGVDVGERLLDAVATVLTAAARNGGAVGTYDRQTFALLLPGYAPVQAMEMADRIRKLSMQCPLPTPNGSLEFTLSIGAAQAPQGDDASHPLGRAEAALDSAVRAGGNSVFFHNGEWTETAEAILSETACTT